jgi:hypothetical protein
MLIWCCFLLVNYNDLPPTIKHSAAGGAQAFFERLERLETLAELAGVSPRSMSKGRARRPCRANIRIFIGNRWLTGDGSPYRMLLGTSSS